ncbi:MULTISPECIES: CD1247 N-terminal domain-containing protein [Clostridium]|uniref:Zinc ribbon domain protein n=2 Tax=Clostridium TaxID=1485 RepID=A0A151AQX8_9CLOT|nr:MULTISPECIES: CD1247 N-terminal domain-containing protein [Clostridium]KYH29807.1 hypothetical protein CLCOL_04450 [Clostridium colicanis DSM 13634]PRR75188.1 hypothetical protein CPAL_07400 [Clostridium thermopalmarium DSM 5974]PVZ27944.1 hypothetical protein LX19_00483 [Clostridium thermopalmarium DSM 5974]
MSSLISRLSSLKEEIKDIESKGNFKEYKILSDMSDILMDIAVKIDKTEDSISEINEYVTVLDENLGNIEEEIYGFEEEEEEFNSYDYVDIECNKCHEILAVEKEFLNEEDELKCPNCHNLIYLK